MMYRVHTEPIFGSVVRYTVVAEPLTADGVKTEGEDYATRSEAMAELVNWYVDENWRAMAGEGDTLIAVEGDEDVYQITIVEHIPA